MDENLKNLELFFKLDMEIKNELINIAPNENDSYNEDTKIKYGDKLYFALRDIEDNFIIICDILGLSGFKEQINNLFKKYHEELVKCNYNYQKMKEFYQNFISNMSEDLIKEVKENFVGYTLFNNLYGVIDNAKTINELLHVFHSFVVNNERFYGQMPKIKEIKNEGDETITLYGKESPIAKMIIDNFPTDLNVGTTDIISLNNRLLIMVRDKGHALTIEVEIGEEKSMIRYFIPKVCNPLMVNELKGVNKIKDKERFTNGRYECNTEDLVVELYDFISKVPTDADMFTYGGWYYDSKYNTERGRQ